MGDNDSSVGEHVTALGGERAVRDEAWVVATFGDVGTAPSTDVTPDPDATEAPNTGHPK